MLNVMSAHRRPVLLGAVMVALFALVFTLLAFPREALARSYEISGVSIDATVTDDGRLLVTETRTFDFDGSFNGVYWDIPTGYNRSNGQNVEVNILSASVDGQAIVQSASEDNGTYTVTDRGSVTRLKIFSRNSDRKADFTISYEATGIATRWADTGELYWKFVSDGWDVKSQNVVCTLHLPVPAGQVVTGGDNVRAWGHGPLDAEVWFVGNDVRFDVPGVGTEEFAEMRVAFPAEWLSGTEASSISQLSTIMSEEQAWADEANARRTAARVAYFGTAGGGVALSVATLLAALHSRRRFKRENAPTFQDKYYRDVPTGDHPAVLGALHSGGKVDSKEVTASLMRLTDMGAIRLDKVSRKKKGVLGEKTVDDYRLTSLRDIPKCATGKVAQSAERVDRKTMSFLFDKISHNNTDLYFSEIEKYAKKHPNSYLSAYDAWSSSVEDAFAKRFEDGAPKRKGVAGVAFLSVVDFVVAFIAIILFIEFEASVLLAIAVCLLLIASSVASIVMIASLKPLNREGVETKAKLEALRRWLCDFTRLEEAIPSDVVLWNQLLVMAVVLGVADRVIEQLRVAYPQILDDPYFMPTYGWYRYAGAGLRPPAEVFTSSADRAHNVSVAATASSSSSSGGGGGGGFSGGGGGGFGGGGGGGAF